MRSLYEKDEDYIGKFVEYEYSAPELTYGQNMVRIKGAGIVDAVDRDGVLYVNGLKVLRHDVTRVVKLPYKQRK